MSDKENKICSNYIELSAREILPITRRLFEEKVSLTYSFKISQFVEKEKNLIIYGDPGSGKTSTLQWLRVIYAGKYLREKKGFIPIYAALDSFTKSSFYDYLEVKAGQEGISETGFKKLLKGEAIILLDGLDLLTYSNNFSPIKEISAFISEYGKCRYIITSRPGFSENIKNMFAICELERLTDEKIDAFIEKYVIDTKFQNIFKTQSSIETSLKAFLQNPLELSLWLRLLNARIVNITDTTKENLNPSSFELFDHIPSNRAELYRDFVSEIFNTYKKRTDHLSHKRTLSLKTYIKGTGYKKIFPQRKRFEKIYFQEITSLKRINFTEEAIEITDLEIFISNLAFKLQRKNKYSCSYNYALQAAEEYAKTSKSKKTEAKSLLEACLESGILTENRFRVNSEARLGISRPLQEYFASFQLKTYFESGMDVSEVYRCPRWENIVIFTSETTEAADKLVDSIILSGNLDLASKCLINCSPETKEKLCTLLLKKFDTKYSVEKIRTIQSLGRLGACGINGILKAFKDTDVWVRREAATVLGETKSELALAPLETALGDEDFSVRIEAVRALGRIGSDKAVELLKDVFGDKNRAVRLEAAEALMNIGSEKALEILISSLGAKDDFVRFGAIGALSRTNSQPVVKTLIKLFQEENKLIRLGAAEALGQMKAEKAIESFVKALEDEDEFVRWVALKTLGEIRSDRTSDIFINMLSDKSRFVRREAVKGLATPRSANTFILLFLPFRMKMNM